MEKNGKDIVKEYNEFLSRIVIGIGEASEITGVPIRKLRYWLDKGILKEAGGSKIKFDLLNVRKILLIQEFLEAGFTLDAAARKVDERGERINDLFTKISHFDVL